MKTLQEKLDELIKNVPYDEIRQTAFNRLTEEKLLDGRGADTRFVVLEVMDVFRKDHMPIIKQLAWDHVYRQIRKNLAHDLHEWTQRMVSEELMKKELDLIDLGVAG